MKSQSWTIEFFNKKVKEETLSLPLGIRTDFYDIMEGIRIFGPNLGPPWTKQLERGLFEIRAKGQEGIGRGIFCTLKGQRVIIFHSFVKKSQKTPTKELGIALKGYQNWLDR